MDGREDVYGEEGYPWSVAIRYLMEDFNETDPDKMHYKELADAVRYFKETEEGRQILYRMFDEVADKTREEDGEEDDR